VVEILEGEALLSHLPHRPPFLFLDRAEVMEESITAQYTFKPDEYFFKGHFPQFPIVPAVICLEALGQAGVVWIFSQMPRRKGQPVRRDRVFFAKTEEVRMYSPVLPGQSIELTCNVVDITRAMVSFEGLVTSNGQKVLRMGDFFLAYEMEKP
jgi:3-hydroxyacyl-[acyl-carrier-protein] dehydratase